MSELPPGFVLDQDPAALPQGFALDAAHPVAGPSGNLATDAGRFLGTAGVNAAAGLIPPFAYHMPGVGYDQSGHLAITQTDTTPQQARDNAFNNTGVTEYQPQTMGGRMGLSALSAALSGTPAQALPSAAGGAVAQAASELVPNHPTVAALLGFAGGAAAGGKALNALGAKTGVVPAAGGSLPLEDAALAKTAQDQGIPLSLAQVSTSRPAKYADSLVKSVPFSGAEGFDHAQTTAFNRAVSRTFGEDAPRITPEVLQSARDRIGSMFDGVAQRSNIQVDQPLINDLANLETRVNDSAMAAEQKNAILRQINNVQDVGAAGNGTIAGAQYQTLTKTKSPLADLQKNQNADVSGFAGDLRDALDGALQRHAAPEDLATLQTARQQWKALRTVEPLTLRADTPGVATPSTGDISPAALRGAVNKSYTNAANASLGDIPLNDLAKVGQRFLKEPGTSGTGERHLLEKAGATAVGALEATREGVPLHYALAAPVAAWGTARLAGALLRNQGMARNSVAASLNPNGFQFPATPNPLALQLLTGPGQPSLVDQRATATSSP